MPPLPQRILLFGASLLALATTVPSHEALAGGAGADPIVEFSIRLPEGVRAGPLVTDVFGNTYVTGIASRGSLQTSPDVFQPEARSDTDAFVAKFDRSGRLVWATYLGGSASTNFGFQLKRTGPGDEPRDIAVDAAGFVYVSGVTASHDFPTLNAVQTAPTSLFRLGTAFLTKFEPNGRHVVYSTLFGGQSWGSSGSAIAVDALGNAYLTGSTSATDFVADFNHSVHDGPDRLFIARFGAGGRLLSTVAFAGWNSIVDADLDAGGALHILGTIPRDLRLGNSMPHDVCPGNHDAWPAVLKLSSDTRRIHYIRFLCADVSPSALSIDHSGRAVVLSQTLFFPRSGPDGVRLPLPITTGPASIGGVDVFVARLAVNGRIEFARLLGGSSEEDRPVSVGVGFDGSIRVAASTRSLDLPGPDPSSANRHPDAAVMRSDDAGLSWQRLTNQTIVFEQLFAGRDPNVLWGRDKYYLYRSGDGGQAWTRLEGPPARFPPSGNTLFSHVALAPQPAATLFAVGGSGVWRSADAGNSWLLLDAWSKSGEPVPRIVAPSPVDPATLFVGTSGHGLRVSTDGGRTWLNRGDGLPRHPWGAVHDIQAIAVHPRRAETVYLALSDGIFRSLDGGASWSPVLTEYQRADGSVVRPIFLTTAISADGSAVYAGTTQGLFSSVNSGTSWRQALEASRVDGIHVSPTDTSTVFVTQSESQAPLLVSHDRGVSWETSTPPEIVRNGIRAVALPFNRPATIYAAGPVENAPFVVRLPTSPSASGVDDYTYLNLGPAIAVAVGPEGHVTIVASDRQGSQLLTRIAPAAGGAAASRAR